MYVLHSEYHQHFRPTAITYIANDDNGNGDALPFEGSDGRRYGWRHVTNADGDYFDRAGNVVVNVHLKAVVRLVHEMAEAA